MNLTDVAVNSSFTHSRVRHSNFREMSGVRFIFKSLVVCPGAYSFVTVYWRMIPAMHSRDSGSRRTSAWGSHVCDPILDLKHKVLYFR